MTFKVLISDKMSPKAKEIFEQNNISVDVITGLSEEELCKIIGDYEGLAIRSATKVTKKVISYAKKLKVIGRAGIGVDNIDKEEAASKGIVVMNTPFGNSTTTAEHAIALMFSLARDIPIANNSTHAGKWEKSRFMGKELTNKTLGIIGCGNIGSIVADRAKGLRMKVIAFDPFLLDNKAKELCVEKVDLENLLKRSDFITLHTPLNDKTKGILNKESLLKTKKGVYIINCARGGLIDESALKEYIESGHISGVALDVFEKEPAKENILFGLEQVICTPHLGASTSEAQENVAIQVAEQLSEYLKEGIISNSVNTPSISSKEAKTLLPYLNLTKNLSSFLGNLISSELEEVSIEFKGSAANLNTKPIVSLALSGILGCFIDSVNKVNALSIAKERSITVNEIICKEEYSEYQTLIKICVKTKQGTNCISGTLFGDNLRIVYFDDIKLEAGFGNIMLFIRNEDKPGLIGDIGRILGQSKINIGNFHLGRSTQHGNSIALVDIDSVPNDSIIEDIKNTNSVIKVKLLKF